MRNAAWDSRPGFLVALFILGLASDSAVAGDGRHGLASFLNPKVHHIRHELENIEEELRVLPGPPRIQSSIRVGYHSDSLQFQDTPQHILIDLQSIRKVDRVALIAVNVEAPMTPSGGYGFPLRFKVDLSNNRSMKKSVVLADYTKEDYPNPGDYPALIEGGGKEGRWLRITSTKHFPLFEHFIFALSEVIVISDNYNVAAGRPAYTSSAFNHSPTWHPRNLTDSQSPLSIPYSSKESPTNGWSSAFTTNANARKWAEIDLLGEYLLDEVRLIPAFPTDAADFPGKGFPSDYQVEVRAENGTTRVIRPFRNEGSQPPGLSPIILQGDNFPARYLRLETSRLRGQPTSHRAALAEIQIYSEGKNVAQGRPVTVSDQHRAERWTPEALTDGFSSRYEILEWPDFLDQLQQKKEAEVKLETLRKELFEETERTLSTAAYTTSGISILGFGILIQALMRTRRARREESEQIRQQIARDLHDDLGSSLSSIQLIGQMNTRDPESPEKIQSDMQQIVDTAGMANESIRDIVWLVQHEDPTLQDLINRMRDLPHRLDFGITFDFQIRPNPLPDRKLSIQLRRHVFFAFKEMINNLQKHADASQVSVEIEVSRRQLRLHVKDDGKGFDPEAVKRGFGLENMKARAAELDGEFWLDSQPESGTRITLTVPIS